MRVDMEKRIAYMMLLAFAIRVVPLLAISSLGTDGALYDGDSGGYTDMGRSFAKGDLLFMEDAASSASVYRTPGYPIFLGVLYFLSLGDLHIALIQILLDSLMVFFIYKIAETVFGSRAALLAALLYALNPTMILFSFKVFTESLFNTVFIIANYYFVRTLYANEKNSLAIGILFSLLAIIRPVGIFFSLIYACVLYLKTRDLRQALLIFIPSLVLPMLWTVRNQQILGYLVYSGIPELNTLCWQASFLANDNIDAEKWGAFIEEYHLRNYSECNRLPYEKVRQGAPIAFDFIMDNFQLYLAYFAKAVFLFFAPATPNYVLSAFGVEQEVIHLSEIISKGGLDMAGVVTAMLERPRYLALLLLSAVYEVVLYALFMLGALKAIKEKRHGYFILLFLLLFVYTLVSAGLVSMFSSYRYRMPIEIFLILFAANKY